MYPTALGAATRYRLRPAPADRIRQAARRLAIAACYRSAARSVPRHVFFNEIGRRLGQRASPASRLLRRAHRQNDIPAPLQILEPERGHVHARGLEHSQLEQSALNDVGRLRGCYQLPRPFRERPMSRLANCTFSPRESAGQFHCCNGFHAVLN